MAADPRKRQKQLERRNAKQKSKKQALARVKNLGLADRLAMGAKCPIHECWMTMDLLDHGMGNVCVTRKLSSGLIAIANFLVDRFCLGVKNIYVDIIPLSDYTTRIFQNTKQRTRIEMLSPEDACKFVESSVAYAKSLGLNPHADYRKGKLLLEGIDASRSTKELEFGKDGKPFYISGPYDTPERIRQIMATLAQTSGPDNIGYFHKLPVDAQSFAPGEADLARRVPNRIEHLDEVGRPV